MLEIRKDYLSDVEVLISGDRALRPNFFTKPTALTEVDTNNNCPFCPENKHMIEHITAVEEKGRIRALLNKYPAIKESDGVHEVLIDTDIHSEHFTEFSAQNISAVFNAISRRIRAISLKEYIRYIQVFKNDGAGSGASIAHSHWQILGLPFTPQRQQTIHAKFKDFYTDNNMTYIQSLYNYKDLIIFENQTAFAYMPYASPYDYNINIAPKRHVNCLTKMTQEEIDDLARALKSVLKALKLMLGPFPFNICLQRKPQGHYYESHFYMEIIPRMGGFAGLELGAQVYVNGHPPEEQAVLIREYF